MLTVWGGMLGNEPPCDRAGMLNFAHGYAPQHVWAAARAGEPLGEVVRHRMPWSQWRRYDKLRRLPAGLVVCGDAICSFNPPVYGQGMTVGALDALALRDCLRSGADDLPRRYFRKSAKSIAVAWRMSAGNDLAFPEVQGRRTLATRATNRVADWVLGVCSYDAVVAEKVLPGQQLPRPAVSASAPPRICISACDGQTAQPAPARATAGSWTESCLTVRWRC